MPPETTEVKSNALSLATAMDLDPSLDPDRIRSLPEKSVLEIAHALDEIHLRQSRGDLMPCGLRSGPDCLAEYAIKDEGDGSRIKNSYHHIEWQDHLTENPRAVIISPVAHGKTAQISTIRTLYELGRDTRQRIGVISNGADTAEKIVTSLNQHITGNRLLRRVFPMLKRSEDRSLPWNKTALTVQRDTVSKDPSIQAFGILGQIVSSRFDQITIDDVLDYDNTSSEMQRQKVIDIFDTSVNTRQAPGKVSPKIWAIGTPWADGDLLDELGNRPGFAVYRNGAVLNPHDDQEEWIPLWPEGFSRDRLIGIRDNTSEHAFWRKYLCTILDSSLSRFRTKDINRCLANGAGRIFPSDGPTVHPQGSARIPTYTGVDLGVGQKEGNDLTSLFTIGIDPNYRRIVLDIQSGQWPAPEIRDRILETCRKFGSIVMCENNGAQDHLRHFLEEYGLATMAMTTTGGKKFSDAFGVESISIEFSQGLWVIPSNGQGKAVNGEILEWLRECRTFTPADHTGDRLIAAWIAREAARMTMGDRQGFMPTVSR